MKEITTLIIAIRQINLFLNEFGVIKYLKLYNKIDILINI